MKCRAWILTLVLLADGRLGRADDSTPVLAMPQKVVDPTLVAQLQGQVKKVQELMADSPAIDDPVKRQALCDQAKPVLLRFAADYRKLAGLQPVMDQEAEAVQVDVDRKLAILGDAETLGKLQSVTDGNDPAASAAAKSILLSSRWRLARGNADAQQQVLVDSEALARAHPESVPVSEELTMMARSAPDTSSHEKLLAIVADETHNTFTDKLKSLKAVSETQFKMKGLIGKPFRITGKTVNGKAFDTADWHGKVVMVDFWATWCGPCKEELPNVQKLYADLHDKGLEIVGVSSDFSAKALDDFVTAKSMPWPQLFDADAAGRQEWNPIATTNGVDGIPQVFVIDRAGNLISADARLNYRELVEKEMKSEKR